MDYGLIVVIGLGVLISVLIPLAIFKGIIKPKGATVLRAKPSKREMALIGLAFSFFLLLLALAISPFHSGALIIGSAIFLSAILSAVARKWKSNA